MSKIFIVLLISMLTACSPLHLVNGLVSDEGYIKTGNISYGRVVNQQLDIYTPKEACENCPVVVWIYGGGWTKGEKAEYDFIGEAFTSAGFIVVIPDYRKYPEVQFPGFVEDVAKAVQWTASNIAAFGGSVARLNLIGHSAGAHIIMLLAFDQHYLMDVGLSVDVLQSATGLAGPYDFLPLTQSDIAAIFAAAQPISTSQPIDYVSNKGPRILLATGLEDKRVSSENSLRMAQEIRQQGGQVELIEYPDIGHSGILLSLSKPFRGRSTVYQDTIRFIREASN